METKLKLARKSIGLTQREVAKRAETTERNYQRIESGRQMPNAQTARLIAQALNSTVEDLFEPGAKIA